MAFIVLCGFIYDLVWYSIALWTSRFNLCWIQIIGNAFQMVGGCGIHVNGTRANEVLGSCKGTPG